MYGKITCLYHEGMLQCRHYIAAHRDDGILGNLHYNLIVPAKCIK
jgi:hypothetical protein